MYLRGWKYEGRKISDKLHNQILQVIEVLNDPKQVVDNKWPDLQIYLSKKMGVAPGQIRTIKRVMEAFGILKKGKLNCNTIPKPNDIFTDDGRLLIDLLEIEKLMRLTPSQDNIDTIKNIKSIYQLYYQKMLKKYSYNDSGNTLHPLRATLKVLRRYESLDYWEWYLMNTVINNDDDLNEEKKFDELIKMYRSGKLIFNRHDLIENQLSHSYVLGNFAYTGLICLSGSKTNLKITLNEKFKDVIDEIIK